MDNFYWYMRLHLWKVGEATLTYIINKSHRAINKKAQKSYSYFVGHKAWLSVPPIPMFIWAFPDSKVHGANMGPILGRQDPDGPHVGPMNFAIWVILKSCILSILKWLSYWHYGTQAEEFQHSLTRYVPCYSCEGRRIVEPLHSCLYII